MLFGGAGPGFRKHKKLDDPTMLQGSVNDRSPPNKKITLFRSLFRGRKDVYPRRFESRTTGKTGYSPVCNNQWVLGICERPCVICTNCQHRVLLPVTDDVIHSHLTRKDRRASIFVAGVYSMLEETCFFLAIDLNKADWQDCSGNMEVKLFGLCV